MIASFLLVSRALAACPDPDGDGVCAQVDACPLVSDPSQGDADGDGAGDACDVCAALGDGVVPWGPSVRVTPVISPATLAAADLDQDGDLDPIVGVEYSGVVGWAPNLGGGRFGAAVPLALGETPAAVTAGDLDGDGDADVAWVNSGLGSGLSWAENLGRGGFAAARDIDAALPSSEGLIAGDDDLDGDQDLLVAGTYGALAVHRYRSQGDGTFAHEVLATLPSNPRALARADLDGDGDLDLVVEHRELSWLECVGPGAYGPLRPLASTRAETTGVVPADLDGDLDPDLVVVDDTTNGPDELAWLENVGGAFTLRPALAWTPFSFEPPSAGDLDADGDVDLVWGAGDHGLVRVENLGGGTFAPWSALDATDDAYAVLAADLEADGDADVLYAQQRAVLALGSLADCAFVDGDGDGVTDAAELRVHGSDPGVADTDADGLSDGVEVTEWGTSPLGADSDGDGRADPEDCAPFRPAVTLASDLDRPMSLAAADLDGDADLDLLVGELYDDRVWWLEDDGSDFGIRRSLLEVERPRSMATGDLDGDGRADLVVGTLGGALLYTLRGPPASFGPLFELGAPGGAATVAAALADLDLDGDLDVLSAHQDHVSWNRNSVPPVFSNDFAIATLDTVQDVVAADLDGDGDPDVSAASSYGRELAWIENAGGGAWGREQTVDDRDVHANAVAAGDLDGDGDLDLVAGTLEADELRWFENVGGGFAPGVALATGTGPVLDVAIGDLDRDGDADVVAVGDGGATAVSNLGGGSFRAVTLSAARDLAAVVVADLERDGDADVAFTSADAGTVVWLENHAECAYPDGDHDGLPDDAEGGWSTDPGDADSDDDGLSDGQEVLVWGTDPRSPDTDGDGVGDGDEVAAGSDPTDATSTPGEEHTGGPAVGTDTASPGSTASTADTGEPSVLDGAPEPRRNGGCGCASGPGAPVGWLVALALVARRRRTPERHADSR